MEGDQKMDEIKAKEPKKQEKTSHFHRIDSAARLDVTEEWKLNSAWTHKKPAGASHFNVPQKHLLCC